MSAEDDASRTTVPRLIAAGADLTRIRFIPSIRLEPDEQEPVPSDQMPTILAADLAAIETAAAELGDCQLIVIDPVTAYLSGVDDHRNTELRRALAPVMAMAERLDVAVVLVTHLNKTSGAQAQYRPSGSIAYRAACRANYLFVRDHTDPSRQRILICDNGNNLVQEVPTLSYTIESRNEGPVVAWGTEPLSITADEALQAQSRDGEEHAERRECDRWLGQALADGPVLANHLRDAAKDAGFTWDEMKRAKTRIGAQSDRKGFGPGSKCYWHLGDLPDESATASIERT
jgi:hypothetical protein